VKRTWFFCREELRFAPNFPEGIEFMNTLKVINTEHGGDTLSEAPPQKRSADAVERLFEHWVFMFGKNPRRCALGRVRRKVITEALALYDEETLEMAIEGCASSAWHAGENDRGKEFNDIELIFRNEAKVERFAEDGEQLRARAAEEARPKAVVLELRGERETPEQVTARRTLLRDLAARICGRG
jgi:hypothetical protein